MDYTFYIKVNKSGYKFPFIEMQPMYEMLSHLSYGELSVANNVLNTLSQIENCLNNNSEFSFGGDDWCNVKITGEKALIYNCFDEYEDFEMDSSTIIKLMREWYEFLVAYESNKIPGIKYIQA